MYKKKMIAYKHLLVCLFCKYIFLKASHLKRARTGCNVTSVRNVKMTGVFNGTYLPFAVMGYWMGEGGGGQLKKLEYLHISV